MDDPSSRASDRGGRRQLYVTVAVVVSCLVAAAGFGIWALRGSGGDAVADGAGADVHDGHEGHGDVDVLGGCDPVAYHNTMMMFDPIAADGLLESGCQWPYDATISVDGGQENPAIDAPFEPHRYSEIFDLIGEQRYGMCSVATLADEQVDGFVFGFGVALNPAGCADGVTTMTVSIREYATRALRDAAASAAVDLVDSGEGDAVVFGRWVVSIVGADAAANRVFAEHLLALGAAPVSG
jgi:hypothetical protein